MSEENKVIDDEVIDSPDDDAAEEQEQEQTQDENLKGFMSKADWVASGKSAKDWRDPVEFRHRGEMIKLTNDLRREKDNEIKNLNLLHSIRLQNEREELDNLRDKAIDIGDRAEVKRLDARINSNVQQAELVKETPQQRKSQEVIEWESDNPWSSDPNDPRLALANSICNAELAKGKSLASALRAVDKAIAEKFISPSVRDSQMVEGSRTTGGKREASSVVWADLKPDEMAVWKTGMFNNPKEKDGGKAAFLKAVANDRKGGK